MSFPSSYPFHYGAYRSSVDKIESETVAMKHGWKFQFFPQAPAQALRQAGNDRPVALRIVEKLKQRRRHKLVIFRHGKQS